MIRPGSRSSFPRLLLLATAALSSIVVAQTIPPMPPPATGRFEAVYISGTLGLGGQATFGGSLWALEVDAGTVNAGGVVVGDNGVESSGVVTSLSRIASDDGLHGRVLDLFEDQVAWPYSGTPSLRMQPLSYGQGLQFRVFDGPLLVSVGADGGYYSHTGGPGWFYDDWNTAGLDAGSALLAEVRVTGTLCLAAGASVASSTCDYRGATDGGTITCNTATGCTTMALGTASRQLSNSLVGTSTVCAATWGTADTACLSLACEVDAGVMIFRTNANCTAAADFCWQIIIGN